jgi:hypothetical protein
MMQNSATVFTHDITDAADAEPGHITVDLMNNAAIYS